jgi:hypothetical protein
MVVSSAYTYAEIKLQTPHLFKSFNYMRQSIYSRKLIIDSSCNVCLNGAWPLKLIKVLGTLSNQNFQVFRAFRISRDILIYGV